MTGFSVAVSGDGQVVALDLLINGGRNRVTMMRRSAVELSQSQEVDAVDATGKVVNKLTLREHTRLHPYNLAGTEFRITITSPLGVTTVAMSPHAAVELAQALRDCAS